ncbi:MAG TPA: hypothetical protein VK768_04445 [Chthoniobacterales bacterium]|jgi:hypothetical protein|nr:hypothetical protein [Chthoniobacterales bacterium]
MTNQLSHAKLFSDLSTPAVGRYRDGQDRTRTAFERVDRVAGFQVPEPQRPVLRCRDGTTATWRHRNSRDSPSVTFEPAHPSAAV